MLGDVMMCVGCVCWVEVGVVCEGSRGFHKPNTNARIT
jgi:hypothetical protein